MKTETWSKNICSEELEISDTFNSIWNDRDTALQNNHRISIHPATIQTVAQIKWPKKKKKWKFYEKTPKAVKV